MFITSYLIWINDALTYGIFQHLYISRQAELYRAQKNILKK